MVNGTLVKEIFNDALDLDTGDRETFVAKKCASNAELGREVKSLLDAYYRIGEFLKDPATSVSASEMATQVLESEEASAIGKLVGAYRIEKEIGRGGMGAVYLASRDDQAFTKNVAIKLLRAGTENESVVQRFEKERQVLADLEHPNIARLIDGGTTENGLPYFVMEYVAGSPIDKYCDERDHTIEKRLRLFRQICSAVEFAHEHSIIHRDIKPGNILVNIDGIPKLLDFGIAKSSDGNTTTASTATGFRVMTPQYASPEQMRGDRVGKATDIYSLGVLLYQLITGERPYDLEKKSPLQIVKAICEEVPPPPSSKPRVRLKKGTLYSSSEMDKIVLKALRKSPERRYVSVGEFSEDISRLLNGVPVKAQNESIVYRGTRFFARNRAPALATLMVSFVFLLAGAFFGIFERSADANTTVAAKDADEIRRSVVSDKRKGGTENVAARELYSKAQSLWEQRTLTSLRGAAEFYQRAIDNDPEFAIAYSGLANSYFLMGVWGGMDRTDAFAKAKQAALRAIELSPNAPEGHLSLAMVHWLYAFDWPAARSEFTKALELNSNYTRALHWQGLFMAEMGNFEEAIASEERALTIEPDSMYVMADLGRVLFYARRYEDSLKQYKKVLERYPTFEAFYWELLDLYAANGMRKEYFDLLDRINGSPTPNAELREAYNIGGETGYRRKALELSGSWLYSYARAEICSQAGEFDMAIQFLNDAVDSRDHRTAQLKVNPRFDPLRSDSRFIALLKSLRLE